MERFRDVFLKIERGTLKTVKNAQQRGSSTVVAICLTVVVALGGLVFIVSKFPPSHSPSVPEELDCAAGFELDIEIEARKPSGDAWDEIDSDAPPDPSGMLTLYDGEKQTEIFLERKNRRKVTAPFFNKKQRRSVSRSATFDLRIRDVDLIDFDWFGTHVDSHDFIASFENVSLESLLEGRSVSDGSATITGARCLSN